MALNLSWPAVSHYIKTSIPAQLSLFRYAYPHISLSELWLKYEINADGCEHILGELIFLHDRSLTAKRVRRLDLPTPLLPIKSTFMLRSLSLMLRLLVVLLWHSLNSGCYNTNYK